MGARRVPCPIRGCPARRSVDYVMCTHHWYRVPKAIRDRVWDEFRKEKGSDAHRAAVADAIRAAQESEQRGTDQSIRFSSDADF